jgi:hypothetical protein
MLAHPGIEWWDAIYRMPFDLWELMRDKAEERFGR